MTVAGFIVLPRDEMTEPALAIERANAQNAWLWLVLAARFAAGPVKTSRGRVHLERGQVAMSDSFLMEAWQWKRGAVRRFISRLQRADMIRIETGQCVRVITICDYERFQEFRSRADHKAASGRQRTGQNQDSKTPGTPDDSQKAPPFGASVDLGMGTAGPSVPTTMRDRVIQDGLPLLRAVMAKPDRSLRPFLGRLLRLADDDGQRVITALHDCADRRPVDARTWLLAACGKKRGAASTDGLGWMVDLETDDGDGDGPTIEGRLA